MYKKTTASNIISEKKNGKKTKIIPGCVPLHRHLHQPFPLHQAAMILNVRILPCSLHLAFFVFEFVFSRILIFLLESANGNSISSILSTLLLISASIYWTRKVVGRICFTKKSVIGTVSYLFN